MIQNALQGIGGIGIYGVISICLFFVIFSIVLVRAWLLKKSDLDAMSSLPLQDDRRVPSPKGENRHERE